MKNEIEQQKRKMIFETLKIRQICILLWWKWVKPKKLNKFYEMIEIGKSVRFAFKDSQSTN